MKNPGGGGFVERVVGLLGEGVFRSKKLAWGGKKAAPGGDNHRVITIL